MQELPDVTATLERLFPDEGKRGKIRSTLVGLPDRDLCMLFCDTDGAVKEALLQRLAALTAAAPGTTSMRKTFTLITPPVFHGDDPESFQVSFNEQQFKDHLRNSQIIGLIEVEQPKVLVMEFSSIIQHGIYTHAPPSKEAFRRVLGEARHLQQAREDEFARALLLHLEDAEPQEGYEIRQDLRLQMSVDGKIREDDVVVLGDTKAWIGSHKTHAKGAQLVKQIADRVEQLSKLPSSPAPTVKPAFMVERADPSAEDRIDQACKNLHVLRFRRSGHAVRVVNAVAVGKQYLFKL